MKDSTTIRQFIHNSKNKKIMKRVVSLLCVITVFFTMNNLKKHADTLERIPTCGYEYDHVHDESCYDEAGELICGLHEHTDACYQERPVKSDDEAELGGSGENDGDVDGTVDEQDGVDLSDLDGEDQQDGNDTEDENGETGESGETDETEVDPIIDFTYDLAGNDHAFVSDIAAAMQVDMADVQDVLAIIENDGDIPAMGFEPIENDYLIYIVRDFQAAEIAIQTADELISVTLLNGAAMEQAGATEETDVGSENANEYTDDSGDGADADVQGDVDLTMPGDDDEDAGAQENEEVTVSGDDGEGAADSTDAVDATVSEETSVGFGEDDENGSDDQHVDEQYADDVDSTDDVDGDVTDETVGGEENGDVDLTGEIGENNDDVDLTEETGDEENNDDVDLTEENSDEENNGDVDLTEETVDGESNSEDDGLTEETIDDEGTSEDDGLSEETAEGEGTAEDDGLSEETVEGEENNNVETTEEGEEDKIEATEEGEEEKAEATEEGEEDKAEATEEGEAEKAEATEEGEEDKAEATEEGEEGKTEATEEGEADEDIGGEETGDEADAESDTESDTESNESTETPDAPQQAAGGNANAGKVTARDAEQGRHITVDLAEVDSYPLYLRALLKPADAAEESTDATEEPGEPATEENSEPATEENSEPADETDTESTDETSSEPAVEENSEPSDETSTEPASEENSESTDETNTESTDETSNEPAVEENNEPATEENSETSEETSTEPAVEENTEPADETNTESTDETSNEPAVEENTEPVADTSTEPVVEENTEPAIEENTEPAVEENTEPVADTSTEPAVEENVEPVMEGYIEPVFDVIAEAAPIDAQIGEVTANMGGAPVQEEVAEAVPVFDAALLSVEVVEDDYLITPIADFETTDIVFGRDTVTLLNGKAPVTYPAQTFTASTAYVDVTVIADEGAFPAGTTMIVKDVEDETTIGDITDTVTEDFVEVKRVHAVDITFMDLDGNEIEPLIPITVVMTVREIEQDEDAVVVHVDDEGKTEVVEQEENVPEQPAEEPAAPVETAEGGTTIEPQSALDGDDTTSVGFVSDAFSVYAVVVTQTIETRYIAANGETWNISVGYGQDALLPPGARLEVRELAEDESAAYYDQAAEALPDQKTIALARFFDITILDAEGKEIQPEAPVEVRATLAEAGEAGEGDVKAVHFADEGVEVLDAALEDDAVAFEASGFSVYGIVYTVDFYYDVDGTTYEFHINGEGHILLSQLFEALHIDADAAQAVNVEFTDPALVAVRHIEEDVALSQVLAEFGRDEEAADETLRAVDWLLVSLAPFTSHETLTVTMADGKMYVIQVEDGQNYDYRAVVNDGYNGYMDKAGTYDLFSKNSSGNYIYVNNVVEWNGIMDYRVPNGGAGHSVEAKPRDNCRFAYWLKIKDNVYSLATKKNSPTITWEDRGTLGDATFVAFFAQNGSNVVVLDKFDDHSGMCWVTMSGMDNYRYPRYDVDPKPQEPKYVYNTDNVTLTANCNSDYFFVGWYDQNNKLISANKDLAVNTITADCVIHPVYTDSYKYSVIANDTGKGAFDIRDWGGWSSSYGSAQSELLNLPLETVPGKDHYSFKYPVYATATSDNEFVYWLKDDRSTPVTDNDSDGKPSELKGFADTTTGATNDSYNVVTRATTYIAFFKPSGSDLIRINPPSGGGRYEASTMSVVTDPYTDETVCHYCYSTESGKSVTAIADSNWRFVGWYNNETELISNDPVFNAETYFANLPEDAPHRDLSLTPVFTRDTNTCNVWFDASNGVGGGSAANNTFYTRIESSNTIQGSVSMYRSVTKGTQITAPAARKPQSDGDNKFVVKGWYDIYHGQYYKVDDPITITEDTVFYADWAPSNYDIGQNSAVAYDHDTNRFITTRVFDYNNLFNMDSIALDRVNSVIPVYGSENDSQTKYDWNNGWNREYWHMKGASSDFIFMSTVSGFGRSLNPYDRDDKNKNRETSTDGGYYTAIATQGLLTDSLKEKLFDPEKAAMGKRYVGTANKLYNYNDETGYYYYDSDRNAASYNQSEHRFYVYDYTNMTDKSWDKKNKKGDKRDFLPFNYGKENYNPDSTDDPNSFVEAWSAPNYWFGMSSEIEFFLPNKPGYQDENGNYGNQSVKGTDMVYKFAGDDDVWVFVDDVLVLDMGGIHGKIYGEINFSTGEWKIVGEGAKKQDVTIDNSSFKIIDYQEGTGRVIDQGTLNNNVKEGDHTLTLYYLERGSSQSNCAIYFNLAPRYRLKLHKVDNANSNISLAGAVFGIYSNKACDVAAAVEDAAGNKTNVFTTDASGYIDVYGLVAGKTYYIKEKVAPEGYPDVSEEVIELVLDANGNPTASSTADNDGSDGNPVWTMVSSVTSSETGGPGKKGDFMLSMEVKNIKEVSISAQKIWAMIDESQYTRNEECNVTVRLQRYQLSEGTGDTVNHKVRLITRYYADDNGIPTNMDTGKLTVDNIETCTVSSGGSISFRAQSTREAGIASVEPKYGIIEKDVEAYTGSLQFYMNGGWSQAVKNAVYTLNDVKRDTDIYITFIGATSSASEMGMQVDIVTITSVGGTGYSRSEDEAFNVQETVNGQPNGQRTQVVLNKDNNWKTTWKNLESGSGGMKYYYYVEEISNTSALARNPLLTDIAAFVTTTSSDGLSGGGTITVRNTLQAVKVKLRKRDASTEENLSQAKFKIYTEQETQEQGFVWGETDSVIEQNVGSWLDPVTEQDVNTYTGTDNNYDPENKVFVSDDLGRFYFGYLPLGTYYIYEVDAPAGYERLTGPLKIQVTESGIRYQKDGEQSWNTVRIDTTKSFYNVYIDDAQKHLPVMVPDSVTVYKTDTQNTPTPLPNAVFTLYSDAQLNNVLTTYKTGEEGTCVIDTRDTEIANLLKDMASDESLTLYLKETAAPAGYMMGTPQTYTITVTKTVTGPTLETELKAFVTRTTYEMTIDDEESVTVTNTPIEITVAKVISDTITPLAGAEFTLTRLTESGGDTPDTDQPFPDAKAVDSETGRVVFSGVPAGHYKLEETKVPDGYVRLEGPYYIDVEEDGTSSLSETATVSHAMIDKENDENVYTVQNTPGVALPHTGGIGTRIFYVVGSLLVLAAVILLITKRRMGEE